jgi:hypothetical protein
MAYARPLLTLAVTASCRLPAAQPCLKHLAWPSEKRWCPGLHTKCAASHALLSTQAAPSAGQLHFLRQLKLSSSHHASCAAKHASLSGTFLFRRAWQHKGYQQAYLGAQVLHTGILAALPPPRGVVACEVRAALLLILAVARGIAAALVPADAMRLSPETRSTSVSMLRCLQVKWPQEPAHHGVQRSLHRRLGAGAWLAASLQIDRTIAACPVVLRR